MAVIEFNKQGNFFGSIAREICRLKLQVTLVCMNFISVEMLKIVYAVLAV